jgi:type III pantothenate kinase
MNLCIDQGNSSTKIGIFNQDKLVEFSKVEKFGLTEISEIFGKFSIDACILSSVIIEKDELVVGLRNKCPKLTVLSHLTPIPVENRYKTPETLGKDRLAAVVGASFLKPGSDILVIDAGTAIT